MMSKSAVMAHLAGKTNLSKRQIVEIFDETLALACKEAKNGFVFRASGNWCGEPQGADGPQSADGEPIKIPAKRVCKSASQEREGTAVLGKK